MPNPSQEVKRFSFRAPHLIPMAEGSDPKADHLVRYGDHEAALSQEREKREAAIEEREQALYAFFDDDGYPEAQLRSRLALETRRADRAEAKLEQAIEEFERRAEVPAHQDTMALLSGTWRDAASYLHSLQTGEKHG